MMLSVDFGARVTTRKIGPPVVGEVRGILMLVGGEAYLGSAGFAGLAGTWEALYPGWQNQPIVFVAVELSDRERTVAGGATHRLLPYPLADLEVL